MKQWIKTMDRIVDSALLLLFILLFLVGGYTMYDTYLVYARAQDRSILAYKPESEGIEAGNVQGLSEDVVAWITVEDTNIDYPVMQGEDNNEYLNTDPFGNYSLAGSIFLDARNASDFSDSYSLIYGHHMEHGAMFGALDKFLERDYFDTHRSGTLIVTGGKRYDISFFACVEADGSLQEIFAPNENAGPMEYIREHATVWYEPDGEHLLAMSTCKFPETSERIVVFGVLRERKSPEPE